MRLPYRHLGAFLHHKHLRKWDHGAMTSFPNDTTAMQMSNGGDKKQACHSNSAIKNQQKFCDEDYEKNTTYTWERLSENFYCFFLFSQFFCFLLVFTLCLQLFAITTL